MSELQDIIYANDYIDLLIPYSYTTEENFLSDQASYFPQIINELYGMIHVPIPSAPNGISSLFRYNFFPKLFVPLDTIALENTQITTVQNTLELKGNGILMGFIDTGILYTHPAFRLPGNRSRIIEIWDQTIPDQENNGPFGYGTIYKQESIDEALASENPLEIVPSTDTNGHGTFLAGVAGGNEDPVNDFLGAAPDCSFAIVKLKEAKTSLKEFYFYSGDGPVYQETDLLTGISYLRTLAQRQNKPLVLCIGVGTNQGDHMGYTPIELSLSSISIAPGLQIITAGGNEAGKSHHYFGNVPSSNKSQQAEILVPENSHGFFLELWGKPPELFSVGFRSPKGEVIPRIPSRLGQSQVIEFFLDNTKIYVNYELIQDNSSSQLIFLRFVDPSPGVWTIDVYDTSYLTGDFHMWLPISGFMKGDVTFLTPDPFTTITTPGNASQIITITAFDAVNNSIFINASRGFTRDFLVKPDIAAPGVNVSGPNLRDGYRQSTGTSVSAALTAGAIALLQEWGLTRETPPSLYSTSQMKNFLIRGADRTMDMEYPNPTWGYGTLNLFQIFNAISTN